LYPQIFRHLPGLPEMVVLKGSFDLKRIRQAVRYINGNNDRLPAICSTLETRCRGRGCLADSALS
jgi:hypothetical protein